MSSNYSTQQQHEPLRVPSNWGAQEKRFVAQLEEILDDLYKRFNRLRMEDLGTALRNTITTASDDAEQAKSTVEQTAQAFEAKFDSIGANGEATKTGITTITQDGVKVEHSEIGGYTQLNADGMRMHDENGDVVGGVYKLGDEVVSAVGTIVNPKMPSFRADVNEKDEAFEKVIGLGMKVNGELLGIIGGHYMMQGADGIVTPQLWIASSQGTGLTFRATNSDGTMDYLHIGDGDALFDLRDRVISIKDLASSTTGGGGNVGGVKFAYGHTSVNDSTATVLDYSRAGFTDLPYVFVNYCSPTRWSGDAGPLKVYYKTTTQANVIVGGSFPNDREIDWFAVGV